MHIVYFRFCWENGTSIRSCLRNYKRKLLISQINQMFKINWPQYKSDGIMFALLLTRERMNFKRYIVWPIAMNLSRKLLIKLPKMCYHNDRNELCHAVIICIIVISLFISTIHQALDTWKAYNNSVEQLQEVEDKLEVKLQTPPNVHSTEIDTLNKELSNYKVC